MQRGNPEIEVGPTAEPYSPVTMYVQCMQLCREIAHMHSERGKPGWNSELKVGPTNIVILPTCRHYYIMCSSLYPSTEVCAEHE